MGAYELLGMEDLLGDDDVGDDLLSGLDELDAVLGARRRGISRRGRGTPMKALVAKAAYKKSLAKGAATGAPSAGAKEWPLGLSTVTFLPASGTLLSAIARPQRLFRGRRLVVTINRSAGAAALAVTVNQVFIGADNQLIAATPLPADGFAFNAVDTSLLFSPASPGIDVTIQYAISAAPAAGEFVIVNTMIIGDSWGS